MALPVYDDIMLPLLESLSDNNEQNYDDILKFIIKHFSINSEDQNMEKPAGGNLLYNRITWAKNRLTKSRLLEPKNGKFKITPRGLDVLKQNPFQITKKFLEEFDNSESFIHRQYWLIRPGSGGSDWKNQKVNSIIGIHYFHSDQIAKFYDDDGNLSEVNKIKFRNEIENSAIIQKLSKSKDKNAKINQILGQFNHFMKIKPNDIILALGTNKILDSGTVIGHYKYQPEFNFPHIFPVQWDNNKEKSITNAKSLLGTITPLSFSRYRELLNESDGRHVSKISPKKLRRYIKILEKKKQLIFFGPPGTGKTLAAFDTAKNFIKNNSGISTMTFKEAIKQILIEANRPLHYAEITKQILERDMVLTHGKTPENTVVTKMSDDIQENREFSIFKKTNVGTYTLNPNIIHSKKLKNNKSISKFIRAITFHQSYSYEDFIEGIKPAINDDKVSYKLQAGIFRQICNDASSDQNNKYILIIDEINRGNISKIFGELITLIEKDKRGNHTLQLAYSKDDFSVPKNLFIIGTMNTADRSLVQMDTALRRRFSFIELMPEPELLTRTIAGIPVKTVLDKLNRRIREAGLRERQIGHSYFMGITDLDGLQFAFAHNIVPLLQDYFFDDYDKLEKNILNNGFVNSTEMIIKSDWHDDPQKFLEILKEIIK